jgi:hypothetical protein
MAIGRKRFFILEWSRADEWIANLTTQVCDCFTRIQKSCRAQKQLFAIRKKHFEADGHFHDASDPGCALQCARAARCILQLNCCRILLWIWALAIGSFS